MAFDIVLTSEANDITVGRRAVMPEWSFSSTHTLDLLETAGWLHAASNTPPRCPSPPEGRACPRAAPARLLPAAGPNPRARPAASSQQARDGGAAVQAVGGPHPRRALPRVRGRVCDGCAPRIWCRPPPPPRTKWTRRVPHPVLIGHAAVPHEASRSRTNRTTPLSASPRADPTRAPRGRALRPSALRGREGRSVIGISRAVLAGRRERSSRGAREL
jgi:hypothetical protein